MDNFKKKILVFNKIFAYYIMSLKEEIAGLINKDPPASEDELKTKLNEIINNGKLKEAVATITGTDQLKAVLKAIHDSIELTSLGGKRRKTRRTKRKGKGKKSRRY